MTDPNEPILAEQIAYYRARASEYDEWFLRRGRYDRGDEHRRVWFNEVSTVRSALDKEAPRGDVLELACGTGIWTSSLADTASRLTAVDASPEVLAINQSRTGARNVSYVLADIFSWSPPTTYDFVFFGFWLSHVPVDRFEAFWDMLARALKPTGRAFFVDNLRSPNSTAVNHRLELSGVEERQLNDGRSFRIVKVFHEPEQLAMSLAELGWESDVRRTDNFFIYGSARTRTDKTCLSQ